MTQQGRLHGEGGGDNPCLYTMEAPVSEGKGVREGGEGGGYGIPPGYQLPGNYYSVPALKAPAPPPLARPPPATHPPGDHPVSPLVLQGVHHGLARHQGQLHALQGAPHVRGGRERVRCRSRLYSHVCPDQRPFAHFVSTLRCPRAASACSASLCASLSLCMHHTWHSLPAPITHLHSLPALTHFPTARPPLSVGMLRAGVMPGFKAPATAAAAGGGGDGDDAAGPSGEGGSGGAAGGSGGSGGDGGEPGPHMCESKLRALLAELHAMKDADGTAKALVFSQYK